MNGKKAREIREAFKKSGVDVLGKPDYRVMKETEVNVLINGKLTKTTRVSISNKTKYGYRRAKKDLIRGNISL